MALVTIRHLRRRQAKQLIAEEQLFDVEHVKALTLDAFSAPIFIMKNGEIVFANQACCKAFGLASPEQIVGHHITQRLCDLQPDGLPMRQSLDDFNQTYRQKGFVRRMWAFKKLDGSANIVRSTVAKIPHDRYRCSVAIVDDLEAFAAEHMIQQSAVRALSEDGTVKTVADCVTTTATHLMEGARSLNESCTRASRMLQEALASTQQAAVNTSAISSSAREMSEATDLFAMRMSERQQQIEHAARETKNVSETLSMLSAATSRIGDIARLMTAFASQTQLLALNATIEAARAGEAGRGFSVVAAEVKTLARQSETASQDVRKQISEIQTKVVDAQKAGVEIASTFARLQTETYELADDLVQQRTSTHGINATAELTAEATSVLHRVVNSLSKIIHENGVMSTDVLSNSTKLKGDADLLQRQVREYTAALS